jgi:hypothetical protein
VGARVPGLLDHLIAVCEGWEKTEQPDVENGPPRRCWTLRVSRKTTSAASPRTSVGCRRAPIRKRRPPGSVPGMRPTSSCLFGLERLHDNASRARSRTARHSPDRRAQRYDRATFAHGYDRATFAHGRTVSRAPSRAPHGRGSRYEQGG